MDDRQLGIRCHDCPKVQEKWRMLAWHPTIGGFLLVDGAAEFVCGNCYQRRIYQCHERTLSIPSHRGPSAAGGVV
jgi:hypothetical protein